jgi:DNA-binding transcriptional ArsR family regulator
MSFLSMWLAMTAAMMVPSLASTVWRYATTRPRSPIFATMRGNGEARAPSRTASRGAKARQEARLSRVFHCLADPARRKILALLRESGELQVGVVGQAFAMTQNGVSKHVKVLERAGLVRRRIEGRVHWISVDWSALQAAYEFLHAYHHFWSTRLDALVDYTQINDRAQKATRHE